MTSYNMDGLKNLNMEGLKNLGQKYKEESVEERKKRRCQLAFPAILNLASGIAMVAIGAVFHDECVGNKATLFLMVGGSILLAASSLKLLLFLIPMDCGHKTAEPLSGVLDFAYFIVAIWGSVQVFGAYPTWEGDDINSDHYCPQAPFLMAFISLIFFWIFMPLCCCCHCCAACCKNCKPPTNIETIA